MPDPTLKLVKVSDDDPLPFERRYHNRHQIAGRATIICETDHREVVSKKIAAVELHNISSTGLGVTSAESLDMGRTLTVLFPAHGPEAGLHVSGRVVRCLRKDYGYDIGISLASRTAAA